eukprot:Plantae.Rhodophyta-Purpureofilum_apyrenoidigerum.ctg9887.p1 GENE.Plantae.Rhodophyta-Purpureofilum_apyrenoidigerum.ctg9887~~Plantae.Rhodophyta-Purpureofilum_apyrenoidigerum.ctg9887.p1  ORF type:complete len:529 (-),score=109.50 Plantae.Rhodophyta-Purpureofilum_apyrenoidigerum.ctg9887:234-1763(-)
MAAFVPAAVRVEARRASPTCMAATSRSPWPVGRFLKDLVFFTPIGEVFTPKAEMKRRNDKGVVVVTGTTGGTGKRVVKELLKRGYRVRAVVRTEERARKALGDDVGEVELIVTDLYNLQEDFFKGARAVISCTGTKIGPSDDTPDRSKYYQGVKFYDPVVLEDTPENVEFKGICTLAERSKALEPGDVMLDFVDEESTRRMWGVVDDIVMGGVSESAIQIRNGTGIFQGSVSTANRGGFASVRTRAASQALPVPKNADKFILRVKGDGNRYKFIVRTDEKWDGIAFCFSFDTVKDKWIDVDVPFDQLRAVFRAKTVEAKFDPRSVRAVQFMLSKFEYDGELNPNFTEGPFCLNLDKIFTSSAAPKILHVSSAGVTRVLRKDEFPNLENEPPAVRMNKMLGRVLEWKLAGEDVIRASGVPYVIIRPCALTEEPATNSLQFDQGDTLKGQIPREDVAKLIVDILEKGSKSNVTFEVSKGGSTTNYLDALRRLQTDNDKDSRQFADFPYVPK